MQVKKLLLFSTVLILSCTSEKVALENIQIMAYNYEPDYSTQQLVPKPVMYSYISANGKSLVLKKLNYNDSSAIGYELPIEQKLIDEIRLDLKLKEEKDFNIRDTSVIETYDGPVIRIKVSSTNRKEMSFILVDKNYDAHSKFYIYKQLYDLIIEDKTHHVIDSKKIELLKVKQKNFAKYTHHKDSLLLPIPPLYPPAPKIDEVRFVKPPEN